MIRVGEIKLAIGESETLLKEKIRKKLHIHSADIIEQRIYKKALDARRKEEIPSQDALSQKISKDMKKRGFRFVGPTIIYSYLQAIGVINDHVLLCPCYKEIVSASQVK